MSIIAYIFCIVRDLGVVGVAWKIQVIGSLQMDDFFTTGS